MRNQQLFNEVADFFRRHPKEYDQHTWTNYTECGTYRCILGAGIYLSGLEDVAFIANDYAMLNYEEAHLSSVFSPTIDGAVLFGITPSEANILFHGAWEPKYGLTLVEALEKLGAGAHIKDVTHDDAYKIFELALEGQELDSSHY